MKFNILYLKNKFIKSKLIKIIKNIILIMKTQNNFTIKCI